MSLDDIVGLLARLSAFAGMGRGPLMYIAQYAVPRYFEPGEVLFNEGEKAETAYLVLYGNAVAVSEAGNSREFYEGDLLGELAMFTQVNRNSTCVARTRLTVLEIHRKLMHGVLRQDPLALDYTRSRIARRISEIRSNLEMIRESLDVYAIPGEARMEMVEDGDAVVEADAANAAADGRTVDSSDPMQNSSGEDGHADMTRHAEAQYADTGYSQSRHANGDYEGMDHTGTGEAGAADDHAYPDEYSRVLSVLGPVTQHPDENEPAPEYDQTELPSLWPRPPVAA